MARGSIPEDPNLWAARYNGPGNSSDGAQSLAVAPDGSKVFVTGESGGSSSYDYAIVAYSTATGAELWVARYNGPGNSSDGAQSLAVAPDGSKVFVTGHSYGSGSSSDYATVAYSTATGAELWVARYNGPGNSSDVARFLAVAPDGSKVFVSGYIVGSGSYSYDYGTVAYSTANGAEIWVAPYNGPGNSWDYALSLTAAPDGSKVFVTGASGGSDSSSDYATVAYSTNDGAEIWVARYNGPGNSGDVARSIAVAPDGSKVFVTGGSYGSGSSSDYATVAYSTATGAELWVARYNGPGNSYDGARSLTVAPDGSQVFVTGTSEGLGSSSDYTTVAYSTATGPELWVARYNGSGNSSDGAYSLAVAPDGSKVFVTGYSHDSRFGSSDYTTVAYRAATSCANGRDETGPASGQVHRVVPLAGPTAAPYVHGVNCDVVAGNGL